jgi:hypothetical protein
MPRWVMPTRNGHRALRDDFAHALDLTAASDGYLSVVLGYRFRIAVDHGIPVVLTFPDGLAQSISEDELSGHLTSRRLSLWQLAVLARVFRLPLPVELEPVSVFGTRDRILQERAARRCAAASSFQSKRTGSRAVLSS